MGIMVSESILTSSNLRFSKDVWIDDSGVSMHLTKNINLIKDQECSEVDISLLNGSTEKIKIVVKVDLKIKNKL